MEKVVRNGLVAVLYSPEYGAGWSTWNNREEGEMLLFHPLLVSWVESGKKEPIKEVLAKITPNYESICTLGAQSLKIEWLAQGTSFEVKEFDGYESIQITEGLIYRT